MTLLTIFPAYVGTRCPHISRNQKYIEILNYQIVSYPGMDVDCQAILESLPDGVLLVSEAGIVLSANRQAEALLGYSREELVGLTLECLVPEGSRESHQAARERYHSSPVRRPMNMLKGITVRRRDGSLLPVDIALGPIPGGHVVATIRDATERRRVEQQLRDLAQALEAQAAKATRQSAVLQSIVDSIGDGVMVLGPEGHLQLVNPAASRIFPTAFVDRGGVSFAKVVETSGAVMPDLVSPAAASDSLVGRALRGEKVDGVEVFVRAASAEGVWTSMSARPLTDGGGRVTGAVLAIRDTTARKAAAEALVAAQEAERKRIARELHDSASQILCTVIMEMEKIVAEMPPSDIRDRAGRQKELLADLAEEVSTLARTLHPAILERVGLAGAVRRLCCELTTKDLRVEFTHNNVSRGVAASSALCVYRVAQEALRNVRRHSQARSAEVTLIADGGLLHLSIVDSGIGFRMDQAAAKGHLGLTSIRERVRLAGGAVSIRSEPGRGTRIEAMVPLSGHPGPTMSS